MVERVDFRGQLAWLKQYVAGNRRRWRLAVLDLFARHYELPLLRPPVHHVGREALAVELRRLDELAAHGVRVPVVLERRTDALLLSDQGPSLATCLRGADASGRDRLLAAAMQAIVAVHQTEACLGQPVPRNMTWDGQRIGFIDFEEDPLEAMTLAPAQARDWLLFLHGVARYYPGREPALAQLLAAALAKEPETVRAPLRATARRLAGLARIAAHCGRHGRAFAAMIRTLREAVPGR